MQEFENFNSFNHNEPNHYDNIISPIGGEHQFLKFDQYAEMPMSTTTAGRGENSYMNLNPLPTQDESRTYGVMSDK
jgi:hypothetical protein